MYAPLQLSYSVSVATCPMGDGDGIKKIARTIEMDNLSFDISSNRFSRDLLQRFMGTGSEFGSAKDDDEDIELNLGLSLGGRFGVDKSTSKLVRSSSVASCLPIVRDVSDVAAPSPMVYTGLARTSSLPVETEEEWRKRKELQTLRRMEAKRRRSEKQRNLRSEREIGGSGSLSLEEKKEIEVNLRERLERDKTLSALKRAGSAAAAQFTLASMVSNQSVMRSGADAAMVKGKGRNVGSSGGMQGFGQPASQGSIESKGGSSSSVSDLESKTLQGSSGELSPASIQSLQESSHHHNMIISPTTKTKEQHTSKTAHMESSPSKAGPDSSRPARPKEIGTNSMEDMPCVFTKGDGPNGRRVDGILYKYGKGEEVRIMCVCHGSFHSPAEFVLHAGGTDVNNPLKHIVVNPNAS